MSFIAKNELSAHQFFYYLAMIAWIYHGCCVLVVELG
jgi:hypothetical protein